MLGFFAEWQTGEIELDPNEIEDADGSTCAMPPTLYGLYIGSIDIALHGEPAIVMDFILGIAEFLLQAIILLGVFSTAFAGVLALTQRKRGSGKRVVLKRTSQRAQGTARGCSEGDHRRPHRTEIARQGTKNAKKG